MGETSHELEKLFADDPELLALLKKTPDTGPKPLSNIRQNSVTGKKRPFYGNEKDAEFKETVSQYFSKPEVPALLPLPVFEEFLKGEKAIRAKESKQASQNKSNKFGRMLFNILFYALIAGIIGGAALFALSGDPGKSYFNYRLYTVKTTSMAPKKDGGSPPGGFNAGDVILVKLCSPEAIGTGDIITYVPGDDPYVYLTHRVVKVLDHLNDDQGIFFVTRGDANDSDDPPVKGDMVVGKKVLVIPGMGAVLQFIRDNFILSLIIIVSVVGSVILLRMYFSGPDKKIRQVPQCS